MWLPHSSCLSHATMSDTTCIPSNSAKRDKEPKPGKGEKQRRHNKCFLKSISNDQMDLKYLNYWVVIMQFAGKELCSIS